MLVARFSCPSCAATLKPANPIPAGKTVKCPKCATAFEVKGEDVTPGAQPDFTQPLERPAVLRGKDSKAGITPTAAEDAAPALVARFACPSCQAVFKPANPIPAGRTVKCPKCANSFPVKPIEEKPPEANGLDVPADPLKLDVPSDPFKLDGPAEPLKPKLIGRFACPHCQAMLKPNTPMPAGKNIKCPKCGQPFAVPNEEAKPLGDSKQGIEPKPAEAASADAPLVSQVTCTGCKANLKLGKPVAVGKKIKCPKCQVLFAVPVPPKPAADDDPVVADLDDDEKKPAADEDDASPFAFSFDEPPAAKKKADAKKPDAKKPDAKKADAKKTGEMPVDAAAAEDGDDEPAKSKPAKDEGEDDDEPDAARRKKMLLTVGGSVLGLLVLAGAALLAVKILGGGGVPAGTEWKLFEPKGGRFTVQMPGDPVPEENPNLEGIPSLGGDTYTASIANLATYHLTYTDLASAADKMTIDDLLQIERKKAQPAGSGDGKVIDRTRIGEPPTPGKEWQVERPEGGYLILRVYLDHSLPRRLFVLKAEGPRIKPDDELATKFFDSFKITGTSTAPVVVENKGPAGVAGWTPDPEAARELMGADFQAGPYKLRPPQGSKIRSPGKGGQQFQFSTDTGRLLLRIEDKESPYNQKDLNDTLELFFKNIETLLIPMKNVERKPTEEGFINIHQGSGQVELKVRFLRRRFSFEGDTGKGVGFVYVAREGPGTVMMFAVDNGPNQAKAINVMDTSVLLWRK